MATLSVAADGTAVVATLGAPFFRSRSAAPARWCGWRCLTTPLTVRLSVAPLLGVRDLPSRALCRAYEVVPSAGKGGVLCVVEGVVVVEFALGLACHLAEDAYVRVAHGRGPLRSGTRIDTATACGSGWGMSSSVKTLNPTVSCRLEARGGSPQSGHAPRCAAAAGVKRSRQGGQQRWITGSPRVLSGQAAPALGADPVHHRVV